MKSIHKIIPIILTSLIFVSTGCKKCKECYFIEEGNGSKTEFSLGEFCDEEIEEQENQNFIANSGAAYVECR